MNLECIDGVKNLKANGHYSNAIIHNGLVYISGQFAVNPDTGEKQFGTIAEEANRVLSNIELYLEKCGSNKQSVIKTIAYISDVHLWKDVDSVYADFFKGHRPVRSVVPVKELHFGFKIEIEVVAAVIQK